VLIIRPTLPSPLSTPITKTPCPQATSLTHCNPPPHTHHSIVWVFGLVLPAVTEEDGEAVAAATGSLGGSRGGSGGSGGDAVGLATLMANRCGGSGVWGGVLGGAGIVGVEGVQRVGRGDEQGVGRDGGWSLKEVWYVSKRLSCHQPPSMRPLENNSILTRPFPSTPRHHIYPHTHQTAQPQPQTQPTQPPQTPQTHTHLNILTPSDTHTNIPTPKPHPTHIKFILTPPHPHTHPHPPPPQPQV